VADEIGRRDQYIENEKRLEMLGRTIDAIHDTPLHLIEFDGSYIRDFDGEMVMRVLNDFINILSPIILRIGSWWKRQDRSIPMQCTRIWALTIDFRMSFIPTSMPLLFLVLERARLSRCSMLTEMSYRTRKRQSLTKSSRYVIDFSCQTSWDPNITVMRRCLLSFMLHISMISPQMIYIG
jgi:hypothetical protein